MASASKRGRPPGIKVLPIAVEDFLTARGGTKTALAQASDITASHLADMLHRYKGASLPTVHKMAGYLHCRPGSIAPELDPHFVFCQPEAEAS